MPRELSSRRKRERERKRKRNEEKREDKRRKRRDREKTTCSLRFVSFFVPISSLFPFAPSPSFCLSVDRMLIIARMTVAVQLLSKIILFLSSLFTASSWLFIFSATSLIMPAGHSVYPPSLSISLSIMAPWRSLQSFFRWWSRRHYYTKNAPNSNLISLK